MRTFAQMQNQSSPSVSFPLVRANRASLPPALHEQPGLLVRRAVANHAEERPAAWSGSGVSPQGYDFSRIPLHAPVSDEDPTAVPPLVHDVLAAPGQALEPATRHLMERHFRHDFGQVRVHTDARAGTSADAVNAHAYTVGNHVVFGPRAYAPGTARGRSLLAHELAHVVQQGSTRPSPQTPLALGDPADSAEQEAATAARTVRQPQQATAGPGVVQRALSYPVLQRVLKTVPTWAGDFLLDEYDVQQGETNKDVNGAVITMHFHPNDFVDAEQIAFVQTAQSMISGKPYNKYDKNAQEEKVATSRMIPRSKPGQGTHIDQMPASDTPVFGMKDSRGHDLANPDPNPKLTVIGFHFTDSGGNPQKQDAMLHDDPNLAEPNDKYQSQIFETAALAIAGKQKGVFYGSVEWGWYMPPGDPNAHLFEFNVKSKDAPSGTFGEAARLWNASKTTQNQPSIAVPSMSMYRISTATELWEGIGAGKKIGTLSKNTRVGLTEKREPNSPAFWLNVVVVSGPLTGQMGWVKGTMLASDAPPAPSKK